MLAIRKKRTKERAKKSARREKLIRIIRRCGTFCTSYPKKKNVPVLLLVMSVIIECTC